MTFSEILALLSKLSDDELETLDEDKFAGAIFTLYH